VGEKYFGSLLTKPSCVQLKWLTAPKTMSLS